MNRSAVKTVAKLGPYGLKKGTYGLKKAGAAVFCGESESLTISESINIEIATLGLFL